MEKSRPEMMSTLLPVDLFRTVLKPVSQRHVTVGKIDCVVTAALLRTDRVVLREDQAHDFAKLDVVQKEVDVYRVHRILGILVSLVLDEVVFADHLNIRVFDVYTTRATKSDCH